MALNFLFEASPVNPATGLTETVRFSSTGVTSAGSQLDGHEWKPVITNGPKVDVSFFGQGRVQKCDVRYGDVSFYLEARHDTRKLNGYVWDGARGRVWVGELGQPFSSYTKLFEGACGPQTKSGKILSVSLMGNDAVLDDAELLASTYAGTGGIQGDASIKGHYKPVCFGRCLNVTPKLIDPVNRVYQVNDGAIADVDAIYEGALKLTKMVGSFDTYTALIGATLKEDEWAKAPGLGMFRMGGEPSKPLTADVYGAGDGGTYVGTLATILPLMIKRGGFAASQINQVSFNAFASYNWGFYADDQVTIGDVVNEALASAGAYLFANTNGVFEAAQFFGAAKETVALNSKRTGAPFVIPMGIEQEEAWPPNYSIKIGADRNWTEMSSDDVSSAINDLAEDQVALNEAYLALQDQANQAAADAALAITRVEAISNDNILDRSEKAQVLAELQVLDAEYPALIAQAANYGITTERVAYIDAKTNLTGYLSYLNPPVSNTGANTPMDRITWNMTWTDVYTARTALLRKIADVAATRANWTGVDGRPVDLGTLDPQAGVKLDGIENGATNGAVIGGNVKNSDGSLYVPQKVSINEIKADVDAAIAAGTAPLTTAQAALQQALQTAQGEIDAAQADIATAQGTITTARGDIDKARIDIDAEIARAKGAEGAIITTVTTAQNRADGAFAKAESVQTILSDDIASVASDVTVIETTFNRVRESILPPNFEGRGADWSRDGVCSFYFHEGSVATDWTKSGGWIIAFDATATGENYIYPLIDGAPQLVPVQAGQKYRLSASVGMWAGTGEDIYVYFDLHGRDRAHVGNGEWLSVTPAGCQNHVNITTVGVWTEITTEITVPSNAFFLRPILHIRGGGGLVRSFRMAETSAVALADARITTTANALSNATQSIADLETVVETNFETNDAKIEDVRTTLTNANSANATKITNLEARSNGAGNLLTNTDFVTLDGWTMTDTQGGVMSIDAAGDPWHPSGENVLSLVQGPSLGGGLMQAISELFAVTAGEYIQFYALTASHRAYAWVSVFFYDATGNMLGYALENMATIINNGGQDIGGFERVGRTSHLVPTGTTSARLILRKYDTLPGEGNSYGWFARPYVGYAREGQTEWNPFSHGSAKAVLSATNAKVTQQETVLTTATQSIATLQTTVESNFEDNNAKINTINTTLTDANKAVADSVTVLEARPSGGGNLLANSEFNIGPNLEGWGANAAVFGINGPDFNWIVDGVNVAWASWGGDVDWRQLYDEKMVRVSGGKFYQNSALIGMHRGDCTIQMQFFDVNKQYIAYEPSSGWTAPGTGGKTFGPSSTPYTQPAQPTGFSTLYVNGQAPANAAYMRWMLYAKHRPDLNQNILSTYVWVAHPQACEISDLKSGYVPYSAGIGAVVADVNAKITTQGTAISNNTGAIANLKGTVEANFNDATSKFASEALTRSNADQALTNVTNTLSSQLAGNTGSTLLSKINTNESTFTTALSTMATRQSVVEAAMSSGGNYANANPAYAVWADPAGLPSGSSWWSNAGTITRVARSAADGGGYSARLTTAGGEHGIFWPSVSLAAGVYILEGEATLHSGSWVGSGITIHGIWSLNFSVDRDSNKVSKSTGVGRRRFTKLIQINEGNFNVHPMVQWASFGGGGAKDMTWHFCGIRAASDEEIRTGEVASDLANTKATVASHQTALTDGRFATAQSVTTLQAQVNGTSGSELLSKIQALQTVTTNGTFAAASTVNSLSSTVGGLSSTVSTQAGTIADLATKSAQAFLKFEAISPGGAAQISLTSSTNGGAAVEIVGNTTFRGSLNVGPDSGQRAKLTNNGLTVFDANNVMRVRCGIW